MRAAAILGLGTSPRDLRLFQQGSPDEWMMGLPSSTGGVDAVLVFGGDGTVHRHLGALVQLGLPVLVVPAGSGNDFARALGLHTFRESLAAWRAFTAGRGQVRAVDLGCVMPLDANPAQHYFACVGGVGLDADIARRANQLPRWLRRSGGYALSLLPALFRFAPFPLKVWLATESADPGPPDSGPADPNPHRRSDGRHEILCGARDGFTLASDQPTVLAAFANAPFYGDGMRIAPEARLDDGLLDVCLIRNMGRIKLFSLFPTVYFGRHLSVKEVEYSKASRVVVESESPRDVFADGEFVCSTPAAFGVARAALRVIV
jgi:diacylglycerol kinase (ATP)